MIEQLQCTEGIILRAAPYRDYDQILTLFTEDQGVLKLFYKSSKKKRFKGSCTPLTRVEVIYKEKNSELFSCEDVILLQSYLSIRERLVSLEAACDLLEALYTSQLLGKAAPRLYQLLLYYLDKLSSITDPWVIANSFRLKILNYEGILSFNSSCEEMVFNKSELTLVELLAFCKTYSALTQAILPKDFSNKVRFLFNELIHK